jgi:hypothetical protein
VEIFHGNEVKAGIRPVFAPLSVMLGFWKMFFMSRDISSLPKTPQNRSGPSLQPLRLCGFLIMKRCFALIRFFENIKITT